MKWAVQSAPVARCKVAFPLAHVSAGIQVDLRRDGLHAFYDEHDVLIEVDAQFIGAFLDIFSANVLGEGLIIHLAAHGPGCHIVRAL